MKECSPDTARAKIVECGCEERAHGASCPLHTGIGRATWSLTGDAYRYLSFTWNPNRQGASSEVLVWLSLLRGPARLGRILEGVDTDRLPAPYKHNARFSRLMNVLFMRLRINRDAGIIFSGSPGF